MHFTNKNFSLSIPYICIHEAINIMASPFLTSLEVTFCYRGFEQTENMCLKDTCLSVYISLVTV